MLRLLGIFEEARGYTELLILKIPHTGGDDHLMTHHLIHSTTSLALYQMMKPHSRTAEEMGKIIDDAVLEVDELFGRLHPTHR